MIFMEKRNDSLTRLCGWLFQLCQYISVFFFVILCFILKHFAINPHNIVFNASAHNVHVWISSVSETFLRVISLNSEILCIYTVYTLKWIHFLVIRVQRSRFELPVVPQNVVNARSQNLKRSFFISSKTECEMNGLKYSSEATDVKVAFTQKFTHWLWLSINSYVIWTDEWILSAAWLKM